MHESIIQNKDNINMESKTSYALKSGSDNKQLKISNRLKQKINSLLIKINNDNPDVIFEAMSAIISMLKSSDVTSYLLKEKNLLFKLIDYFNNQDADIRYLAIKAIENMLNKSSISKTLIEQSNLAEKVIELLTDKDNEVRYLAVKSIKNMLNKSSISKTLIEQSNLAEKVVELLTDKDDSVIRESIRLTVDIMPYLSEQLRLSLIDESNKKFYVQESDTKNLITFLVTGTTNNEYLLSLLHTTIKNLNNSDQESIKTALLSVITFIDIKLLTKESIKQTNLLKYLINVFASSKDLELHSMVKITIQKMQLKELFDEDVVLHANCFETLANLRREPVGFKYLSGVFESIFSVLKEASKQSLLNKYLYSAVHSSETPFAIDLFAQQLIKISDLLSDEMIEKSNLMEELLSLLRRDDKYIKQKAIKAIDKLIEADVIKKHLIQKTNILDILINALKNSDIVNESTYLISKLTEILPQDLKLELMEIFLDNLKNNYDVRQSSAHAIAKITNSFSDEFKLNFIDRTISIIRENSIQLTQPNVLNTMFKELSNDLKQNLIIKFIEMLKVETTKTELLNGENSMRFAIGAIAAIADVLNEDIIQKTNLQKILIDQIHKNNPDFFVAISVPAAESLGKLVKSLNENDAKHKLINTFIDLFKSSDAMPVYLSLTAIKNAADSLNETLAGQLIEEIIIKSRSTHLTTETPEVFARLAQQLNDNSKIILVVKLMMLSKDSNDNLGFELIMKMVETQVLNTNVVLESDLLLGLTTSFNHKVIELLKKIIEHPTLLSSEEVVLQSRLIEKLTLISQDQSTDEGIMAKKLIDLTDQQYTTKIEINTDLNELKQLLEKRYTETIIEWGNLLLQNGEAELAANRFIDVIKANSEVEGQPYIVDALNECKAKLKEAIPKCKVENFNMLSEYFGDYYKNLNIDVFDKLYINTGKFFSKDWFYDSNIAKLILSISSNFPAPFFIDMCIRLNASNIENKQGDIKDVDYVEVSALKSLEASINQDDNQKIESISHDADLIGCNN